MAQREGPCRILFEVVKTRMVIWQDSGPASKSITDLLSPNHNNRLRVPSGPASSTMSSLQTPPLNESSSSEDDDDNDNDDDIQIKLEKTNVII